MKINKKKIKGMTLLELMMVLLVIAVITIGIYELFSNAKKNYVINTDFDNISTVMDRIIEAEGGSLQPGGGSCTQGCGFNDFTTSLGTNSYNDNIWSIGLLPQDMANKDANLVTNTVKGPIYFFNSIGTDGNGNSYPILIVSSAGYDASACSGLVQKFKDKYYQGGYGTIAINGTQYLTGGVGGNSSAISTTAGIVTACNSAATPITLQFWYKRMLAAS